VRSEIGLSTEDEFEYEFKHYQYGRGYEYDSDDESDLFGEVLVSLVLSTLLIPAV
tara:strand:+ start:986 stop:1150 length:165 start_codon:yes stop_codon:yes gene_type:complete